MKNKNNRLPELAGIKQKRVNELSFAEIKQLYRFVLACERLIGLSVKIKNINGK